MLFYMDDILIVAETKEEALKRLELVLDVLVKAGFSFNISKCFLLRTTVLYLGYEIKAGEIRPNLNKIESLVALPPPKSVTTLRQFIGLTSYFRQFISGFSQLIKPLYFLTSEKNSFDWQTQHEEIRSKIIDVLTNRPVLIIFDPQFPIELYTDASSIGYGAILLHRKILGLMKLIIIAEQLAPMSQDTHLMNWKR